MNAKHFLKGVVIPVLKHLDMDSREARSLMLGTALAESGLDYLYQIGGGPAIGVYQVEPETHKDIWFNFLNHRKELANKVIDLTSPSRLAQGSEQMAGNLYYATAIARVHYWRVPDPIPDDPREQAIYWKKHYNTPNGAGDPNQKYTHFVRACEAVQGVE